MTMKQLCTILFVVTLRLAVAPSIAMSQPLTTIDFPGAVHTLALGINEAGEIVGRYISSDGNTHGFLLRAGVFTTIDVPGAIQTNIAGINSHGDIVGRHVTADNVSHVFVLSHSVFTTIDFPGATFTGGARSNNRGQIAGVYTFS